MESPAEAGTFGWVVTLTAARPDFESPPHDRRPGPGHPQQCLYKLPNKLMLDMVNVPCYSTVTGSAPKKPGRRHRHIWASGDK